VTGRDRKGRAGREKREGTGGKGQEGSFVICNTNLSGMRETDRDGRREMGTPICKVGK